MKRVIFTLLWLLSMTAATGQTFPKQVDFVKGADVGFLQGQERQGQKFYDVKGNERECLELLKNDYQMSAIRMRVWVNPRGGSCDKNELLAMAKRVKALDMDLMVDFHYSDSCRPWKTAHSKGMEGTFLRRNERRCAQSHH